MRVKIEVFGKTTGDIGKAIEKARRDFLGGACRVLHTGQDSSYSVLVSDEGDDPVDRPLQPSDFPEPLKFPNLDPKPATD